MAKRKIDPVHPGVVLDRNRILSVLAEHLQEIAARYDVKRLALFGSAARDALEAASDIDVLVEFAGPATFARAPF